jgi:hypothetical protein
LAGSEKTFVALFAVLPFLTDYPTLLAADETWSVASVFSSRIPYVVREEIALRNPLKLVDSGKSFNKFNFYT